MTAQKIEEMRRAMASRPPPGAETMPIEQKTPAIPEAPPLPGS